MKNPILTLLMIFVAALASCGGGHASSSALPEGGTPIEMKYADNLSITEYPDFTVVDVRNPWDTVRTLQRYVLVDRGGDIPDGLPEGTLVRVPLQNTVVYSTVHMRLIEELNAVEAIGGVCNSEFVKSAAILGGLRDGHVEDCGESMNPDMERIIRLRPEAILLSPYENNDGYAKVTELGIPLIECADYMESSPLGRAEWAKFFGLLYGRKDRGFSIFDESMRRYEMIKERVADVPDRPKVLTDQVYGQAWMVAAGESGTGCLIEDAGGTNPFAGFRQSGGVPLAPEKVLAMAHDADIWLIKYNQAREKTLAELAADAPVNSRFKAFKEGNVYGCDTQHSDLFEATAFHPDRLLRDIARILHPELELPAGEEYYKKMN